MNHHLFRDRSDAGRQLAQKLGYLEHAQPLVLALPRGGVPVGIEVAHALHAPLDLLLVRKIGVPWHPELAAGAVIDGARPRTVINEDVVRTAGVSKSELARIVEAELAKIERRRRLWLSDRPHISVAGHSAIVVDDGIATGASARVALQAVRAEGAARLVLATPVAPAETVEMLRAECDDMVCLATPEDFTAVGIYYEDFHQVDDKEVQELLQRAPI
ncbi:putative phosphoribosyl transferase [Bradyrhizobium sp. AZCC 1678]|uniref:phosphoribosyltransferase n=1 Tax=Bradyrhizobium sp. AZCC 1678 TaxID=3117030 RepID=UPI002FF2AACB